MLLLVFHTRFRGCRVRIPGQERECALRAVLSPTLSSPRVHFKLAPFHINNARAKRSSAVSVATAHAPHAVARPRCYSAQPRSLARNSVARVPARSGEWRRARTVAAGTCARRVKPRETALRRTRLRVAGRIDRSVAAHAAPRVRVRLALQLQQPPDSGAVASDCSVSPPPAIVRPASCPAPPSTIRRFVTSFPIVSNASPTFTLLFALVSKNGILYLRGSEQRAGGAGGGAGGEREDTSGTARQPSVPTALRESGGVCVGGGAPRRVQRISARRWAAAPHERTSLPARAPPPSRPFSPRPYRTCSRSGFC